MHLGYKLWHIARSYSLTCNHKIKILSTTSKHPARFNDKSIIQFDDFFMSMKKGCFNDKLKVWLYNETKHEIIEKKVYNGVTIS